MLKRNLLLGLTVAGFSFLTAEKVCLAGSALAAVGYPVSFALADHDDKKMDKDDKKDADEKDEDEKDEKKEKREDKEIEETVPMNMVPQAVLDAVKKEVPNGNITEAELEAKHGHIMYAFDVTDGNMKYEVKITVDGKFFSKKVDEDKDEEQEKDAKPMKKSDLNFERERLVTPVDAWQAERF